VRNAERQVVGQVHRLVAVSVVGTGLTLPCEAEPYGAGDRAHFGHREQPDRSIVNTQIGIVNTGIGDRERSVATPGVQASSGVSPFLQDGPLRAIRWALWSSRSQMASATVASPS